MAAEFSFDELHKCAERELKLRKRVYVRWVEAGRMTQMQANREIAMMEEIANHLARQELLNRLL
jgi:hypothetical protein